jgi:hypothetical protein
MATKSDALSDFVTKIAWWSLAAAVVVFVAMLFLTGSHS